MLFNGEMKCKEKKVSEAREADTSDRANPALWIFESFTSNYNYSLVVACLHAPPPRPVDCTSLY